MYGSMMELVDIPDLKSVEEIREGSNPSTPTTIISKQEGDDMPTYTLHMDGEPLKVNIGDTVYIIDDGILLVEIIQEIHLLNYTVLIKTTHHTLRYDEFCSTFYIEYEDAKEAVEIEKRKMYGINID